MKINGIEWKATHKIFGAYHLSGYNKAILMSCNMKMNETNEQTFSLILYNAEGPGVFKIGSESIIKRVDVFDFHIHRIFYQISDIN
ncbi:MAG: hypothetical protein WAT79_13420 [Saprospiraceae bacterium]